MNSGLRSRMLMTNQGKAFQVEGSVMHDLTDTPNPRLLINGVSIGLKYHLARPRFSVMSAEKQKEYRIEVRFKKIKNKNKSKIYDINKNKMILFIYYVLFIIIIYYFQILDACLRLATIEPTPALIVGHSEALKKHNCQYSYVRSNFKTFSLSGGSLTHVEDDLWSGMVPAELVVAFCAAESYSGSYSRNPFFYQTFDVSYLSFTVG